MSKKKSRLSHTAKRLGMRTQEASHRPNSTDSIVHKICYNVQELEACQLDPSTLAAWQLPKSQKVWVNVHGVHDAQVVDKIAARFGLHPLVVEDILNTEQRPKVDIYPDYIFLETRLFYYDASQFDVSSEQISIVIGKDWLLTFQERPTGSFEPVRERLRAGHAMLREGGVDTLAYTLLDSLMERYFTVLETINEDAENLEAQLLANPKHSDLQNIHRLKNVSVQLRRAIWPFREVLNTLIRNENSFFKPNTIPYLRDLYDHTVHFIESLEAIRDALSSLMDIYMTSVSQRVNLELRALTVVAMLFMPATLIAGIFGMNFSHMPWLNEAQGFWWAISIMVGIAVLMLLIFWRRQWLSRRV